MSEPISIADHSFDSLLDELIAGRSVKIAGSGEIFQLENVDSRALLEYYKRHSQYWESGKLIVVGEIDALLAALDKAVVVPQPTPANATTPIQLWHLKKIEVHRFGGFHRHCMLGDGSDPSVFVAELSSKIIFIHGFNGSGKTSLLNAITWCLIGRVFRAQKSLLEIHELIILMVPVDADSKDEVEGMESDVVNRSLCFLLIVPVPTHDDLVILKEEFRADIWVRLIFENALTGKIVIVKRLLCKSLRGLFITELEGWDDLGLTNLAVEVSMVMPGSILYMRFGEVSELGEALVVLTGLQSFEELGKRCDRLYNSRFQSTEVISVNNKIVEEKIRFTIISKTFSELLQLMPSVIPKTKIIPLGKIVNDVTCAVVLKEIKKEIEVNRDAYVEDAKKILGNSFDPAKSERLIKLIPDAIAVISSVEVKQLRGMVEI